MKARTRHTSKSLSKEEYIESKMELQMYEL